MNIIKVILTTVFLTTAIAKTLNLGMTVNYHAVSNDTKIQENNQAPDNSWSVTISSQETSKSNISTTLFNIQIKRNKALIKYDKLVLIYLCSLLLTNSYAPEPNPGPPKYPCGTCRKAVTWSHEAVCCDNCEQWYHIKCQGIYSYMYQILNNSNLYWECTNCGMPNFSTTFFNSTIETSNSYSELVNETNNIDDIGTPTYTSSPIQKNQNKNVKVKNKTPKGTTAPLRVLTINFQSIKNKKPEIDQIIESCKPDIIFGTETWLSDSISPYEYISPSKFTIYNKNRKDGYGGVLLAISNQYTSSQVTDLEVDCELIWAKITSTNNKTLYLGTYYRPPSDKGDSLEHLSTSLNRVCNTTNPNVWLSGDFNLGHIDWDIPSVIPSKPDPTLHQGLLDILNDNNLIQVINKTTRNDKTLDLLCMTNPSFVNRIETLPPIGGSDHDIVFSEINLALPKIKQQPHKTFVYKKADWKKIEEDLTNCYKNIKENQNKMSLDELWTTFKNQALESIQKHIPTKLISNKSKLPWINHKIKKLINKKNKLYKKKKHDTKYTNKYKQIKTQLQREMRTSYWRYIENMIFDIEVREPDQPFKKKQPKNLFTYIKSQKNENTGSASLRSEGTLHTNPTEKANILNKQFQSAFTSEANTNIPDKGSSTYPKMEPITINRDGIYKLLNNINPNKATGPDNISGTLLKQNINICTDILSLIFTRSIETGLVPSDWNHANVTPVYKKGDKHHPGNYRPISLTCISCKLLEHILASNMMKHLETNKILYELQHGFRANRSCESQVLSLVHQLAQNNNNNIQTDLVIMDFAKAFDKVPHKRLIYKLQHYGISEQTTNWVTSFLSNRTQTVLLENSSSSQIPVTSGVPQGTVLGPILFLIYINDLPDYLKHSQIRLFADDSIIYRTIKSQNDCLKLQEDIESAIKWEQDWLMSFHPDKCNILQVTTKKQPHHFYYNMHGHILKSVKSAKYLGITLSSDLKWNTHINQTIGKANRSLSFIRRNLKINSKTVKERAYQSLVRPKLEYCCTVWDPYTTENNKAIEQVQRRAARYVCHRFHNTSSVSEMINTLDWPSLQERRLKTRLQMFHKVINHQIAIPAQDILTKSQSKTRSTHKQTYRQIQCNKDSYKFSFFCRTIKDWNNIPANIANITTTDTFKEALSHSLLLETFPHLQ